MKDKLASLATAVLVVSALVVVGLVIQREMRAKSAARTLPPQGMVVENWRAALGEAAEAGSDEVVVAVFADYTCRYCRETEAALDSLEAAEGSRVRIRQVHFPLAPDGIGFGAAVAAECARRQGVGRAYHRLLYQNQAELGTFPWDSLGVLAGVANRTAFQSCLGDPRAADAVRSDRRRGEAIGVAVTPTILVGGRLFIGAAGYTELAERVEQAARSASPASR